MQLDRESFRIFEEVVADSNNLLEPVRDYLDKAAFEEIVDDDSISENSIHMLSQLIDTDDADSILKRVIGQYRHQYANFLNRTWDSDGWQASYQQQIELFEAALSVADVVQKLEAIDWISNNLIDRTSMFRLMMREADSVMRDVLDWHFRNIYREIRKDLNSTERRVFQLMYFRLPFNGYRIAAFDELTRGFMFRMGDETSAMISLLLVYKRSEFDNMNLAQAIEDRWRSYLRFYPHWVELIRHDDRIKKRAKRHDFEQFHFENLSGSDDSLLSIDVLHGNLEKGMDDRIQFVLQNIEDLSSKHCTKIQASTLIEYFKCGKTQEEIADERGVSQQAVSKLIRTGVQRIKDGIEKHDEVAS